MQNELNLVENKELREEVIGRIDVLDRVVGLVLLPNTEYATTKMVASFYRVDEVTVKRLLIDNNEELLGDGVKLASKADIVSNICVTDDVEVENSNGKYFIINGENKIEMSYAKTNIFPRRAILRVGMLLRDSAVAKEVRTYLLNVEHDTQENAPEVIDNIVNEIDEEQKLLADIGLAFSTGDGTKILLATQSYHSYVVAQKDKRIKQVEDEKEIIITNALTISDSRKVINAIVKTVPSVTTHNFGEAWNELYKKLNYKLSINVRARCKGKESPLNHLSESEMFECEKICRS